ncbi:hypothetical protein CH275_04280 [Rhodococcus sp. 06-235-1A]|nr:hypothetical protein CH275_04280 [Rhodococcus sp. 06-235-1A]
MRRTRDTETTTVPGRSSARPRKNAIVARVAVSGSFAIALSVLLISAPHAPSVPAEETPAVALAGVALDAIDVTTVLTAVAVLAVVALLRKLPYGIGVVIACTIGAVVTGELVRELAGSSVSPEDLPFGQLVAVGALLGAASMVASTSWRPVVLGLGTVATLAVAASALAVGSASIAGLAGALMVSFVWWPACSIVMLYSPEAAAREAHNPLDTAALAVQRKMGRSR